MFEFLTMKNDIKEKRREKSRIRGIAVIKLLSRQIISWHAISSFETKLFFQHLCLLPSFKI